MDAVLHYRIVVFLSLFTGILGAQDERQADRDALLALESVYEQAASEGKPELLRDHLSSRFSAVMVTSDSLASYADLESYWNKIQGLLGEGGVYTTEVEIDGPATFFGDLAVATGTTTDLARTGGGREFEFTSRWTAVLEKEDGKWKLHRIQATMDPIQNEFVELAVSGAATTIGIAAAAIGLILGWLLRAVVYRRSSSARTTPRDR